MNRWKHFAALAAAGLVLGIFNLPASADVQPFTDIYTTDERYVESLTYLYENGIVSGKTPTTFDLYTPMTRGNAAVMIAKSLLLDTAHAPDYGFTDIHARIKGSVNALAQKGYVSGYGDGTFRPTVSLTRGAAASLLVRAFNIPMTNEAAPFTDTEGTFKPYIDAIYKAGMTNGVSAMHFGTNNNMKRGDFAILLYKSIDYHMKNMYTPVVEFVTIDSATAVHITFKEPVPAQLPPKYTVGEHLDLRVQFEGEVTAAPLAIDYYQYSPDRRTLTLAVDFTGKTGIFLAVDSVNTTRTPFDF